MRLRSKAKGRALAATRGKGKKVGFSKGGMKRNPADRTRDKSKRTISNKPVAGNLTGDY